MRTTALGPLGEARQAAVGVVAIGHGLEPAGLQGLAAAGRIVRVRDGTMIRMFGDSTVQGVVGEGEGAANGFNIIRQFGYFAEMSAFANLGPLAPDDVYDVFESP